MPAGTTRCSATWRRKPAMGRRRASSRRCCTAHRCGALCRRETMNWEARAAALLLAPRCCRSPPARFLCVPLVCCCCCSPPAAACVSNGLQLEADRISLRLIQKLLASDRTARALETASTLHNLPALEGALKLASHHRCARPMLCVRSLQILMGRRRITGPGRPVHSPTRGGSAGAGQPRQADVA